MKSIRQFGSEATVISRPVSKPQVNQSTHFKNLMINNDAELLA